MELLRWTAKAIVVPLLPFLSGAVIRWICLGEFSWRVFGAAELCVSIAILFLLLSTSAGQLQDERDRIFVSTCCYIVAILFFMFFAGLSFVETLTVTDNERVIEDIKHQFKAGNVVTKATLPSLGHPVKELFTDILDRTRVVLLVLLVPALCAAYGFRYKYKLEA